MTKQKQSGEKPETLEEAGLKDMEGWSGATLETPGVPVMDEGKGKTISIREFKYKMNPEMQKNPRVDRRALFNAHAKQISTILWGDGLRPLEESGPRVIIDVQEGIYRIYVPCEARRDVLFAERPKNLTDELIKANKGKLDSSNEVEPSGDKN